MTLNEIKHETESFCTTVSGKVREVERVSLNLQSKLKQLDKRGKK